MLLQYLYYFQLFLLTIVDTDISQGNLATHMRCGEIVSGSIITYVPQIQTSK